MYLSSLGRARIGLGEFTAAETNLLEAYPLELKNDGLSKKRQRLSTQALVDLYTAWDKAESGKGYNSKALEWKKILEAIKPPEKSKEKT